MEKVEQLLRELHHEVIEARGATIKTDHSLKNLSSELRTVAHRQKGYERRLFLNSIAAYVLFAGLCFGGMLLFFQAAVGRSEVDRTLVEERYAALESRYAALQQELELRETSEREAYTFFELLSSGRRDEIIERWPAVQGRLRDRATIELFRREVDSLRVAQAEDAWQRGMRAVEDEQWQDAHDHFTRSIAYVDVAAWTPQLHLYLGESLFHLSDYPTALRYYDLSIASGTLTRQQTIMASFHRAESLQRSGQSAEADEAYRAFARRYESHSWASTARQRAARLE